MDQSVEKVDLKIYVISHGVQQQAKRYSIQKSDLEDDFYGKLTSRLAESCPFLTDTTYQLTWQDNQGDRILVENEEDIKLALQNQMKNEPPMLCFSVEIVDRPWWDQAGLAGSWEDHPGIICSCCHKQVTGFRYKCLMCPTYDMCHGCEIRRLHPAHDMIRICGPKAYPPHFFSRLHRMYERLSHQSPTLTKTASSLASPNEAMAKDLFEFCERAVQDLNPLHVAGIDTSDKLSQDNSRPLNSETVEAKLQLDFENHQPQLDLSPDPPGDETLPTFEEVSQVMANLAKQDFQINNTQTEQDFQINDHHAENQDCQIAHDATAENEIGIDDTLTKQGCQISKNTAEQGFQNDDNQVECIGFEHTAPRNTAQEGDSTEVGTHTAAADVMLNNPGQQTKERHVSADQQSEIIDLERIPSLEEVPSSGPMVDLTSTSTDMNSDAGNQSIPDVSPEDKVDTSDIQSAASMTEEIETDLDTDVSSEDTETITEDITLQEDPPKIVKSVNSEFQPSGKILIRPTRLGDLTSERHFGRSVSPSTDLEYRYNIPSRLPTRQPPRLRATGRIADALEQMKAMGFTDDEGWLTQLLVMKHGDISQVLDILTTVKK